MPTIRLQYNTTNSAPSSTDPLHSRDIVVDLVNDRTVIEEKEQTVLLNRSISEDILGIRRILHFYLRTTDIPSNIDFLTSFLNAPYKWVLTLDANYYFNLGTVASPVAVPVVTERDEQEISVNLIIEEGIRLVSANIYPRPTAPVSGEFALTNPTGTTVRVTGTMNGLKMVVYRSATSGGTLTKRGNSTSLVYDDAASSATWYYKVTSVSIGGESELSPEKNITIAL